MADGEYEILERAFERAGHDLSEARKEKELLAQQLEGTEQERAALAQRVRSLEALAASRSVEAAEQAARDRAAPRVEPHRRRALRQAPD